MWLSEDNVGLISPQSWWRRGSCEARERPQHDRHTHNQQSDVSTRLLERPRDIYDF